MDVPAKGQVGGIESDAATRRRLAEGSRGFVCSTCGKSNSAILQEQEELAKTGEAEGAAAPKKEEEKVPEELKLVYKEDLKPPPSPNDISKPVGAEPSSQSNTSEASVNAGSAAIAVEPLPATQPMAQAPLRPRQHHVRNNADVRLDAAIWVVSGLLIILISRMVVRMIL
jgi:hypothetical protein